MAEVIRVNFGTLGRVHCLEIDLRFPQLFRVEGLVWGMEGEDFSTLHATQDPAPLCYTLHADPTWTISAQPKFVPIDYPDPEIERGWFVIRHHRTMHHAEGYLAACNDRQFDDEHLRVIAPWLFSIGEHIFTLVPRPAIAGKPSPAFIFATEVPHPKAGWVDWYKVILSEGREATIDALYPLPENGD